MNSRTIAFSVLQRSVSSTMSYSWTTCFEQAARFDVGLKALDNHPPLEVQINTFNDFAHSSCGSRPGGFVPIGYLHLTFPGLRSARYGLLVGYPLQVSLPSFFFLVRLLGDFSLLSLGTTAVCGRAASDSCSASAFGRSIACLCLPSGAGPATVIQIVVKVPNGPTTESRHHCDDGCAA